MDKILWKNNQTILDEDIMNTFQNNIEKAINLAGHTILLELNPQTYVMTLTLKDKNGNNISSDTIDLPIESMVIDLDYNKATKEIILTLQNGNKRAIPIGDLISGLVSETDFNTNIERIDKELQDLNNRIDNIGDISSGNFVIDDTLSETSTNPVQNKVITEKLKDLESSLNHIKGEEITAKDSADMYCDLGICGNSSYNIANPANIEKLVENIKNSDSPYKDIQITEKNGRTALYFLANAGYQASDSNVTTLYSNFKENTQYTIKFEYENSNTTSGEITNLKVYYTDGTDTYLLGNNGKVDFISAKGKTIDKIAIFYSVGYTTLYLDTLLIYEGTEEKPYQPYFDSVTGDVNVKIQNKNLFDEHIFDNFNPTIEGDFYKFNNKTLYNNNLTLDREFKEKTSYTFRYICYQTGGNPRFIFKYTDGTKDPIKTDVIATTETEYLAVSNSTKTLKGIEEYFSDLSGNFFVKKNSCMLVEGNYSKENLPVYEEHQEQNYQVRLGDLKLHGNEICRDKIIYKDGKFYIKRTDGTEEEITDTNLIDDLTALYYAKTYQGTTYISNDVGAWLELDYATGNQEVLNLGLEKTEAKIEKLGLEFSTIKQMIDEAILEKDKLKYPVGKIIMETENVNPNTYLGFGTWEQWGAGRVPVGVDVNDEDFNEVEKIGGEKKHKQTLDELVAHSHDTEVANVAASQRWAIPTVNLGEGYKATSSTGGGQPFNIQQQYITCYMWKRTA